MSFKFSAIFAEEAVMHSHEPALNLAEGDSFAIFFKRLLNADFIPHGHCYFWKPEIVWLHVISDAGITLAYYFIPLMLLYFVRKKKQEVPFHWMFVLFSAFILWCGTTHLMNIVTLWNPVYRLDGIVKAITASISLFTAIRLFPLIPQALTLKSSKELEVLNIKLEKEVTEKEMLLREIHHRVKNNLQIITSLLRLQSTKSIDPESKQLFLDSQNRIHTMALLHERLYQSQNLSSINLNDYFKELVRNLFISYGVSNEFIRFQVDTWDCVMEPEKLISCGLIINELVSNSLKYAFPEGRKGEIRVLLQKHSPKELLLTVSDNGKGFPNDIDYQKTNSLGLRLVRGLSEQLKGHLELKTERGTEFRVQFPISIK